jgi:hypothetical protein
MKRISDEPRNAGRNARLTDRILIELLEYVRRNCALPMSAVLSLGDRCFCLPDADIAREARLTNEREDG